MGTRMTKPLLNEFVTRLDSNEHKFSSMSIYGTSFGNTVRLD